METLYRLQKKDLPRSGAVLTDAFQEDPVWSAVFGANSTTGKKHAVFSTPVRYCMKFGEAYATSRDLEGVIAWTPGRVAEITVGRLIRCGGFLPALRIGPKLTLHMESIFRPLMADQKEYQKGFPYLYLHIIGVGSKFQGQGLGGRLLRALMEKSRQAGLPIYLETETKRNVSMYEKLGFKLINEITLPVIHLPMYEMARDPQ